jgi:hypothetical protein
MISAVYRLDAQLEPLLHLRRHVAYWNGGVAPTIEQRAHRAGDRAAPTLSGLQRGRHHLQC